MKRFDIAIVGAGIAGTSLAAELAPHASVLLLEAEDVVGYHATGRSAAFWSETYGGSSVLPLTIASGTWLDQPPPEYGGASFLSPRGEINIGRAEDQSKLAAFHDNFGDQVRLEWLDRPAIEASCDFLRPEWDRGIMVPSCQDIDVAALHLACLKVARLAGADVQCRAALLSAELEGGVWYIDTMAGPFQADLLVNAAGAWADEVAHKAKVRTIGIAPMRRTMLQVRIDRAVSPALPLIIDINGGFYFKADAGGLLWLSPHDETPSPPTDAAPEELDVAIAIERFESATTATVKSVQHKWAGLRSFAPDRGPVYGADTRNPGFFWFAGQGGFGIQTAPAAARLAAERILGKSPDAMTASLDPARYAPSRFT